MGLQGSVLLCWNNHELMAAGWETTLNNFRTDSLTSEQPQGFPAASPSLDALSHSREHRTSEGKQQQNF